MNTLRDAICILAFVKKTPTNNSQLKTIFLAGQPRKESSLQTILQSYKEGFTVHGMSRVFSGYLWDRLLWFIVLLASLVFVLYATYGFLQEYWSFNIYTDIQVKTATDITVPALTICNTNVIRDSMAGSNACYGAFNLAHFNHKNNFTLPCRSESNKVLQQILKNTKYAILHPIFPNACIIINPYGNLTEKNLFRPLYRTLTLESGPLFGYVHGHNDIGFSLDERAQLSIPLKKDITISMRNKFIISRLPSPYTSLCENKFEQAVFPGPYSVRKCRNTCIFKMMLSKCGDVIQQWQIFLKTRRSVNETEARICLHEIIASEFHGLVCDCPASCKEILVEASSAETESVLNRFRVTI